MTSPWSPPVDTGNLNTESLDYADLVSKYDLVDVHAGVVLLAEKKDKPAPVQYGELGSMLPSQFSSVALLEYNTDLMGHSGLEIYNQMRKGDGQVAGYLKLLKTPVLGARWFISPASDSAQDKKVAEFIEKAMFVWPTTSWTQTIYEILSMLDFGYYLFEKVFVKDVWKGKEIVRWQKFAPRHPLDVIRWDYDNTGGPKGIWLKTGKDPSGETFIKMSKLLAFTYDREGGNMEGTSALRPAYKHWFYKDNLYKIDAIQKERHGIGIPCVKLPPGYTPNDKAAAQQLGRNLRTNERSYVVLPPLWDIVMLKLEGQPVDALASAVHHDLMISRSGLGHFINGGAGLDTETALGLFLKAQRYVAELIADVFNRHAIREMVSWNFSDVEEFPELRVRRIGETTDWRTMSFALRNLVGANIIKPDDELEDWAREEMDLPPVDKKSVRETATPQAPGGGNDSAKAGLPRQAPAAGGMKQGQNAGKSNTGGDKSGG